MQRRAFLASLGAAALTRGRIAAQTTDGDATVILGDEAFLNGAWRELAGRSIGVVTNQTGVTSRRQSLVDLIRLNSKLRVKAIYAPEHGFRGDQAAGAYVASYTDPQTGLPVYSLYGPTRHPSEAMLQGVDALLFDIQDVGSRAYTFISTMAYAMQSAKAYGKEFWVLDRPNPVGCEIVEGPVLDPAFSSFIGLYPIPMRHGMTVGELAKLFNDRFGIGANLRVIPMQGYARSMIWPDTGLQWVRSSPNIPTWETTFPYLATGLIDNAGVNNGVGTVAPFFYAGGYGFDADALASELARTPLPGVEFESAAWTPERGFWAGKELRGVKLVITDRRIFLAVTAAVHILCAVRATQPQHLTIKEPASLDRDWGTDTLRVALQRGTSPATILDGWKANRDDFVATRRKYMLY
jgi:uncharacterized protein YbbC (DUF1343 family)